MMLREDFRRLERERVRVRRLKHCSGSEEREKSARRNSFRRIIAGQIETRVEQRNACGRLLLLLIKVSRLFGTSFSYEILCLFIVLSFLMKKL